MYRHGKGPHVTLNFLKKNPISGHCITEHINGSQSLVPRPASVSLGNLLEMQIVRPYTSGLLNEKLGGPAMCFNKPSRFLTYIQV